MSALNDAIANVAEAIADAKASTHDAPDRPVDPRGGRGIESEEIQAVNESTASTFETPLRREDGREESSMPDGDIRTGLTTSQREQLHALLDKVRAHRREIDSLEAAIACELDGVPGLPLDVAALSADVALLAAPEAPLVLGEGEPPLDEIALAAATGALDLDDDPTCCLCGRETHKRGEPCVWCVDPEQRFINTRASANEDY